MERFLERIKRGEILISDGIFILRRRLLCREENFKKYPGNDIVVMETFA